MNHTLKRKETARAVLLWLLLLAVFTLLICQGDALSEAAYDSLRFAARTLVPSMFLFAVATGLATSLPCPYQTRRLPLYSLPTSALPSLAIGLFSGFPMGAYAAHRLWREGVLDKKSAEHLAAFSNNASLAFLYFTVGNLFGSRRAGLLLFFSGTLASLAVGALLAPKPEKIPSLSLSSNTEIADTPPFFSLITESIVSATNAMLTLCGYLTLFGTLAKALSMLALPQGLYTSLLLLLEPTAAVRHLATLPQEKALVLTAFTLGFSGFSILLQSLSVWKGELSPWRLVAVRLLIGALSSLLTLFFSSLI